ncbi:MAG: ABC transporter permease [Methanogenium sp.]|jgi:peptide/nickel transport system permease protein
MSKKNLAMRVSIAIFAIYLLIALFAPLLTPYDPFIIAGGIYEEPSPEHLLGTNDLAQDIFSQLIYGTRATLLLGFTGAILSVSIGTAIGIVSGYYGGRVDEFITRTLDIVMTIPTFPLLLVMMMFFTPGIYVTGILMGLLGSARGVRVIRSQVLSIAQMNFITGVKVMGASDLYVMAKHVLPNLLSLVTVQFVFSAQHFMVMGIGLGFLGLGDSNVIDWGQMIDRAYQNGGVINGLWWWLIPPGMAVTFLSLSLALFGYSMEDEINPRMKLTRI